MLEKWIARQLEKAAREAAADRGVAIVDEVAFTAGIQKAAEGIAEAITATDLNIFDLMKLAAEGLR